MKIKSKTWWVQMMAVFAYIAMIVVNILANTLPIQGIRTGEVSGLFPNLFAPAGITFSIWFVIYLLLGGYVLYQLGFFQGKETNVSEALLDKLGILFSISSLINISWIVAWHSIEIPLSLILMLLLLLCLMTINEMLNEQTLSKSDDWWIRLPFRIYLGWISVATIANVATMLVSIGWDGFGLSESLWTILMLAVGTLIAIVAMMRQQDIAFGLVFIWAYLGIIIKHSAASGYDFQYPNVIIAASIGIVILLAWIIKERIANKT